MATAFSPGGKNMVSVSRDGKVLLWDDQPHKILREMDKADSPGLCVVYSRDGKYCAAGFRNGEVRLYDGKSFDQLRVLRGHAGPVGALTFTPDGARLVSGSADSTLLVWNLGKLLKKEAP
jgi:WD40 repeat protein